MTDRFGVDFSRTSRFSLWSRCLLFLLCILAFTSCTTLNRPYGNDIEGYDLSVDEALTSWDIPQVLVDEPEVYYRGEQWAKSAVQLIEEAEKSVVTTVFLGSWSPETAPVFEALMTKARSGVAVYVVIDSISSLEYTASSLKMKSLQMLRAHGVHLLEYNAFSGERVLMLGHLFLREHRKFLLIDGKEIALGGMNFNYVSLKDSSSPDGQRDAMYVFRSPQLAGRIAREFVDYWNENSWDPLTIDMLMESEPQDSSKNTLRAWVANQYGQNRVVSHMYTAMLDAADKEILLLPLMPYLDTDMKDSVRKAVDRGVTVRMLIPWDMRDVNRKSVQYTAVDLLDLGVELYREREPAEGVSITLLHEKLMIVDDRYTLVGSANFNFRSMELANELCVVVESEELNQRSRLHFNGLLDEAERITREEAETWRTWDVLPVYWFSFIGG